MTSQLHVRHSSARQNGLSVTVPTSDNRQQEHENRHNYQVANQPPKSPELSAPPLVIGSEGGVPPLDEPKIPSTGLPPMTNGSNSILYFIFVRFFSLLMNIFFKEIVSRGTHFIPDKGPVIFVAAPHANQFVDPLILLRENERRTGFLIARKSTQRKFIGAMARLSGAIPVDRPQDLATNGTGTIYMDAQNPLRMHGLNTKFLSEFADLTRSPKQLSLPSDMGSKDVAEVISDTELLLKKPFDDPRVSERLAEPKSSKFKILPVVDQSGVYDQVHQTLAHGGAIGIFPEGGSHDRAELLPLKAGVTMMALGAMAKYPGLMVKIIPCGLNYFQADKFRSRAAIEFGEPIEPTPEQVHAYKLGGTEKRNACSELLDIVYKSLLSVTVNAPDYETLQVIQVVRRLYVPSHRRLTPFKKLEMTRRFIKGYMVYKDEPRVQALKKQVLEYNERLLYHGLKDHQVVKTATGGLRAVALLLWRSLLLLGMLSVSLPGLMMNLPIGLVIDIVSKRKAAEAKAASSVKIAGKDVLATWKLLIGLVLVPCMYALYAIITGFVLHTFLSEELKKWAIYVPLLLYFVLFPIVSYASVLLVERGLLLYRSLKPLFLSIVRPTSSAQLRRIREELQESISHIVNDFGPRIFEDFKHHRIIPKPGSRPETPTDLPLGGIPLRDMTPEPRELAETPQTPTRRVDHHPPRPGSPTLSYLMSLDPFSYVSRHYLQPPSPTKQQQPLSPTDDWAQVTVNEYDDYFFFSPHDSLPDMD